MAVTDTQSILYRADKGRLFSDPYPHLVIENALPEEFYNRLEKTFPTMDEFRAILQKDRWFSKLRKHRRRDMQKFVQGNRRINLLYKLTSRTQDLKDPWPSFLTYHTSAAFMDDLQHVLGDSFSKTFPDFPLDNCRIGRRGMDRRADISLDALLAINTPAFEQSSVKRPHTDQPNKLIAGLLYFADPDDCGGGDLIIYRRKRPPTIDDTKWPAPEDIEEVRRVPYQANTLVLLVNSAWAVHGISPRKPSPYPRRFVNFVAQTRQLLF
jgi:hypothetical protein